MKIPCRSVNFRQHRDSTIEVLEKPQVSKSLNLVSFVVKQYWSLMICKIPLHLTAESSGVKRLGLLKNDQKNLTRVLLAKKKATIPHN